MYSNNLNSAYEYESERRNDERRAAAESQVLRKLGGKRNLGLPSPAVVFGIMTVIAVVIRIF